MTTSPPLSSRRFSPLCVSCNEPIVPAAGSEETVRVVALDKNFHLKCYRCEVRHAHKYTWHNVSTHSRERDFKSIRSFTLQDCARPLSIEADENGCYPLNGRILCMKCHTQRAKQGAQWSAAAAEFNYEPNPKAQDSFSCRFAFANRALFSVCAHMWVRVWERMCSVKRKGMFACRFSVVFPFSLFTLLGAEVMYCTEINAPLLLSQISNFPISHLASFVYSKVFFVPILCLR